MMTLRFFKLTTDTAPDDSYKIAWDNPPGELQFAIWNWLQMHPKGKVEVVLS